MTTFASDVTIPEGDAGRRRRLGVLLICSSSLFIVYLDSTILNVALPTLQRDLHASLSGLQWVADASLLVVSSLLLLAGSTADRLGRKRVFLAGLAWFGMGPTPIRAKAAEQMLLGRSLGGIEAQAIAERAVADTAPFDDHHASAEYRRSVGTRIFARTLREALETAEVA